MVKKLIPEYLTPQLSIISDLLLNPTLNEKPKVFQLRETLPRPVSEAHRILAP